LNQELVEHHISELINTALVMIMLVRILHCTIPCYIGISIDLSLGYHFLILIFQFSEIPSHPPSMYDVSKFSQTRTVQPGHQDQEVEKNKN